MKNKILTGVVCGLFLCLQGFSRPAYGDLHQKTDKKGRVYWHGATTERKIALTFDDGPSQDTVRILEELKNRKVKATFFVIGKNVEKYPEIFERIVADGHAIGNHSYSHPDMFMEEPAMIRRQIRNTESAVRERCGQELYLFRPPYGVENSWLFREAGKHGYTIVKWSVSGFDWEIKNAEAIARRVIDKVKNGSIIILHDGRRLKQRISCQPTIDALPKIITSLEAKGYQFVTVPDLLGIKEKNQEAMTNLM
ncbi:MAG: polysaccharide deacetylase family protein [Candidatus Omnitrophota bacterium]